MQTFDNLYQQLINWHKNKHNFSGTNDPAPSSELVLAELTNNILLPLSEKLGAITITYGFTSPELNRFIQRNNSAGTAPGLDQHASCEQNSKGSTICKRAGTACDFWVQGFELNMHEVALHIYQHLPFDKLYFYGRHRPIHVSVASQSLRHLQVMQQSQSGRRIPGKKAFGDKALVLAKEL